MSLAKQGSRVPWRNVIGWLGVGLSTGFASLWAFWGSIENFHEGWYYREWWRNVGLALIQYVPWMFVPMLGALSALWRPWLGVLAHLVLAVGAFQLFGYRWTSGAALLATPMLAMAVLYAYGRPQPVRWARRIVIGVPIVTALVSGAYPGWRAITRPANVDLTSHRFAENGADLVWAPAGPGWPDRGFTWFEAQSRCDRLVSDGTSLSETPVHLWRLPTVDEAVRTMVYRGRNAGGRWDPVTRSARYRVMPDKDAPLWNRYSQVIYWWTSDEAGENRAYRVVYNGMANTVLKKWGPPYIACRCVKRVQ